MNDRRYDIDYIRVIAFGILIIYHVAVFFEPGNWHIKNDVTYKNIIFPMIFINQWRLPLLFVVSGMGTYFALGKRSGKQYVGERFRRLLLPFIIGVVFIVPPQVYIERISQGVDYGGYFNFWPVRFFNGIYPEGNFSWHHLWFILYLLIFSLVCLPLFLKLRKNKESAFYLKIKKIIGSFWGILFLALPLLLWRMLLSGSFPATNALAGDWFNLLNYSTFFVLGYLLVSSGEAFWNTVKKHRLTFLVLGTAAYSLLIYLWFGGFQRSALFDLANDIIQTFNTWIWILCVFGMAAQYLNKSGKYLSYANEAVYPFYILHQTVIVILGYYVKDWDVSFFIKFPVMVLLTFIITWVIYEYGIRRYKIIRPLFGLKNRKK